MKLFPGDVVEIPTADGLTYVQVTHTHPSYPEVVRTLPGAHGTRPDMAIVANAKTVFSAMLPLGDAITGGRLAGEKIGNFPIPDKDRPFPTFRMPVRDRDGNTVYWWLWDGDGLRFESDPAADVAHLPMREVMALDRFLARLG